MLTCVSTFVQNINKSYQNLKSIFTSHNINNLLKSNNIQSAWYTTHSTGTLITFLKVSKIFCVKCEIFYNVETLEYVKNRCYQHKYNITMKNLHHSVLVLHSLNRDYSFEFDSVVINHKITYHYQRIVAEFRWLNTHFPNCKARNEADIITSIFYICITFNNINFCLLQILHDVLFHIINQFIFRHRLMLATEFENLWQKILETDFCKGFNEVY